MSEHETEAQDDLLEEQEGKGYGEDEGEREAGLEESAEDAPAGRGRPA
ncbi:MAG: hypothetical protein ICV74_02775 [Thermoleophilia bacterium]|nr:hypothetical protein [Thermoleophilia bacterium]